MLLSETPGIIIDVRWYVFLIMHKVCIRKKYFVFIFIVYDLTMRKETTVMVNFSVQLASHECPD